jgi:hypothetical protein
MCGSGFSNNSTIEITYEIKTSYNIKFANTPSGSITSSTNQFTINAQGITKITTSSLPQTTMIKISIQYDKPLR